MKENYKKMTKNILKLLLIVSLGVSFSQECFSEDKGFIEFINLIEDNKKTFVYINNSEIRTDGISFEKSSRKVSKKVGSYKIKIKNESCEKEIELKVSIKKNRKYLYVIYPDYEMGQCLIKTKLFMDIGSPGYTDYTFFSFSQKDNLVFEINRKKITIGRKEKKTIKKITDPFIKVDYNEERIDEVYPYEQGGENLLFIYDKKNGKIGFYSIENNQLILE